MARRSSAQIELAGWWRERFETRSGMWCFTVYSRDESGKKVQVGQYRHPEQEAAREKAIEARRKLAREQRSARAGDPAARSHALLLGDFIGGRWKDEVLPTLKPNTRDTYPAQIRKWVVPYLSGYSFAELNRAVGSAWVAWMREKGASAETIRRAFYVARGIVESADALGLIEIDGAHPFDRVRLPKDRRPKVSPHVALGPLLVEKLAWKMPSLFDTALVELAGIQGMRYQEIIPSEWGAYLDENGNPRARIKVEMAVSGSGLKREVLDLKTEASERYPRFFAPVAETMVAFWHSEGCPDLSVRAFSAERSWDGLIDYRNWRADFFYPALAKAGIARDAATHGKVTPHKLRGAAASMLGHAGWPLADLMAHLGHAQETTTLRYYLRAIEDEGHEFFGRAPEEQVAIARQRLGIVVEKP